MNEIEKFNQWLSKKHPTYVIPKLIINKYSESTDQTHVISKPQWIPVVDGDLSDMSDGKIWITSKHYNGKSFVLAASGCWVKRIPEITVVAWMPSTEPDPYKP